MTNKNDPLEAVAEQLHVGWRKWMLDNGYAWGPERSDDLKQHPHIIAWSQKESFERNQDRFQAAIILNKWAKNEILSEEDLARSIHQTWGAWMYIRGNPDRKHSHLVSYEDAHIKKKGRDDHVTQAKVLYPYLQTVAKYDKSEQWD